MKVYEVYVRVPYDDPDWNTCYDRYDGRIFANKENAILYMREMAEHKQANMSFNPVSERYEYYCKYGKEDKITWVTPTDSKLKVNQKYQNMSTWEIEEKFSKEESNKVKQIRAFNWLLDDIKHLDIIQAVETYGGNIWCLREVELN